MDENGILDRLLDELFRLKDRYGWDPVAVEALEAVQWWAQEESVEPVILEKPYHF